MNKEFIDKLNTKDLYSLAMFSLYKLNNDPDYSTISELAYILDKDNLLKFCKYFGGMTIKVPTIEEIYIVMDVLLLYQYVNIEGQLYEDAVKKIYTNDINVIKIKSAYKRLCKILEEYDIKARNDYE